MNSWGWESVLQMRTMVGRRVGSRTKQVLLVPNLVQLARCEAIRGCWLPSQRGADVTASLTACVCEKSYASLARVALSARRLASRGPEFPRCDRLRVLPKPEPLAHRGSLRRVVQATVFGSLLRLVLRVVPSIAKAHKS